MSVIAKKKGNLKKQKNSISKNKSSHVTKKPCERCRNHNCYHMDCNRWRRWFNKSFKKVISGLDDICDNTLFEDESICEKREPMTLLEAAKLIALAQRR